MREGKNTILYIDDDQDYLDNMRMILEANGYQMQEALSAEEGLRVFKECKPDLVIVDLMMEEVDAGTSFVKEIKAMGANVPIFMLSSVGQELSQEVSYTDLGLDGVFQKPINPTTLLKTLEHRLA
ncbi:response regulator [bacterium]|nr:response regulator [bacterium]